jgi:6-phospho-beta-glucosidase
MKPAIAILGGSTPFTAALVEALRDRATDLPCCELRLFGTNAPALERLRRYAASRLPEWATTAHRRLDEALDGADVVINQIRFGGLDGRGHDEELAASWQVPADETLGPCGLSAALRLAQPMRELAAQLRRYCPRARVLNLSNPLSVTTALLENAVGLCELPSATALEACRLLRCKPADVEWDYAGLNHRGAIFSFRHRGEELIPRLPDLLGEQAIFGITAEDIRRLGALPLKYFRLTRRDAMPARRAQFLIELKDAIARELDAGEAPPPSLRKRGFDWYSGALVPALIALFSKEPRRLVVNQRATDGIVREMPALISATAIEPRPIAPTVHLEPWLQRWEAHERAVLDAVAEPSFASIVHAVELDPIAPSHRAHEIAREIWMDHAQ